VQINPFISLLCLSPLFFLLANGPGDLGVFLLALALPLVLEALVMPAREANFVKEVMWPAFCVAALPAGFMILQILPLSVIAHPAWQSAATALGSPLSGSVSIDTGATLVAFCRYCAFCAGVLLSAAVCVNRIRAEWVLAAASFAAATGAILCVLGDLGAFAGTLGRPQTCDDALFISCFGAILSLAFAAHAYFDDRAHKLNKEVKPAVIRKCLLGLVGALICAAALLCSWNSAATVAMCAGLITLGFVIVSRRLGSLVAGTLATTAAIVAVALGVHNIDKPDLDITLRFVPDATVKVETMQRIVQDEPAFGTGAGTLGSLLQLYRSAKDDQTPEFHAPLASVVSIEMGRTFWWSALSVLSITSALLIRAALHRGRDWIYPATAASCLVSGLLLAFAAHASGGPILLLISATALGLGLAQSRGRTISA
jgi:hypothetical protein